MTARVLVLEYPAASQVQATAKASDVRLALDTKRGVHVGITGRVKDGELFRDALLTLNALMLSDLRYKGKDRAAYLAFLMKKGKKASAAIWEAQKAFLEGAYGDATPRPRGLDPIATVDPDEFSVEVFSRDESAYARLALSNDLFDDRTAAHGTTLADFSPAFVDQLERLRTYQAVDLDATTKLESAEAKTPRELDLPDEWLRGFLQVQSAAALPSVVAPLAAIDLYNILWVLRVRKAKKAPRALRFELVPGNRPRVVIEPWEIALECHGPAFTGKTPRIVRIFGRQRLLALSLALPHVQKASVHLLGAGLPSFWVLDMGLARLTVALTSWSESKWASAAAFDALMPREGDAKSVDKVVSILREKGPLPLQEIAGAGQSTNDARSALQRAALQGRVLFDVSRNVYRPRALLADPVDEGTIRYGSAREAQAHRLLEGKVDITKIHMVAGEGQEISGEVDDKAMHREFSPRFFLDTEGQVKDAWCNCPVYMRSGLREGPCEHMIALRVLFQREQAEAERLRATPEGRKLVHAETRTFMRRDASGMQTTYRVSLDDKVVRIERQTASPGQPLGDARHQRLWFDTDKQARDAYFARLDDLENDGFIDTDATA
jgi:hypothetical protein